MYSISTYIVFIFIYTIWLDFVILLTYSHSRSILHLLCACLLIWCVLFFRFSLSFFHNCRSNMCKIKYSERFDLYFRPCVRSCVRWLVQSLSSILICLNRKRDGAKWHNSDEINYRLLFPHLLLCVCVYMSLPVHTVYVCVQWKQFLFPCTPLNFRKFPICF